MGRLSPPLKYIDRVPLLQEEMCPLEEMSGRFLALISDAAGASNTAPAQKWPKERSSFGSAGRVCEETISFHLLDMLSGGRGCVYLPKLFLLSWLNVSGRRRGKVPLVAPEVGTSGSAGVLCFDSLK